VSATARAEALDARADPDGSFEIEIASSGRIIAVAPDQSAIEALAAAGYDLPVSCEQGICGTCVTMVIAGEPDHRDMFLSPEDRAANDLFTPCCSRANSRRLVLDL
jgi:vanillate O-demethylase ferredoxin subunit